MKQFLYILSIFLLPLSGWSETYTIGDTAAVSTRQVATTNVFGGSYANAQPGGLADSLVVWAHRNWSTNPVITFGVYNYDTDSLIGTSSTTIVPTTDASARYSISLAADNITIPANVTVVLVFQCTSTGNNIRIGTAAGVITGTYGMYLATDPLPLSATLLWGQYDDNGPQAMLFYHTTVAPSSIPRVLHGPQGSGVLHGPGGGSVLHGP